MEMINLSKKTDESVAKGHLESVQDLNKLQRASEVSSSWSYDPADKAMAKAMRTFAEENIETNNQARINSFKRDTFENYYTLKNMEAQVSIAKDNLKVNKELLTATQLKFKVGTASKMNLLTAEMDVNTAQSQLTTAQNGLNSLKMGFNVYMGYDLMQAITLTDTIDEPALSTVKLADAIKSALSNRLEVKEAAYNVQMCQISVDKYKYYPTNSSTYISTQLNLLKAELNNKNQPLTIEMDVRTKYMAMMEKYEAVQSGKQTVANAIETTRLAQLQYDAGMSTLTDVQQAQLGSYTAQLNQAQALLDYNLALEDYNLCMGVGTKAANLASTN